MAIAQRMRRPVPPPVLVSVVVVALVVGAVALLYAWISAPSPSSVPYSQFLSDVEAGRVSGVVQSGTTLEVSGPHGSYQVTVPTVLTDVYADVDHAAAGSGAHVPLFEARPAPDYSWVGLLLTALLPFAVVLVVLVLVLLLVVRPARRERGLSLADRLREVEDAHGAGLISEDEGARRRSRILDET